MKAAVIGAGAAGLFSALALARSGVDVVFLEAGSRVAPLLRGFSRGGLHFDVGFHIAGALDEKGILRRYLNFAGILEHVTLLPQNEECRLFRFTDPDTRADISVPCGVSAAARYFSGLWPEYEQEITGFRQDVENAFVRSPFLNPETLSWNSMASLPTTGCAARLEAMRLPLRLGSLLTACALYYGVPPQKAVFEDLALVTYAMSEGVHRIAGGGAALASAYERALAQAGIRPVLRTPVINLVLEKERGITGVRTAAGDIIACDACIYTGHPSALPAMLPPDSLRARTADRLASLEETFSVFMLFGATSSGFLNGREMFLCGSDSLDEAFAGPALHRSWVHVCCGDKNARGEYPVVACCRAVESPGREAAQKGARPPDYARWKQDMGNNLLNHIREHVPELADLRFVDAASEHTMRDWVYGSRGGIYGAMHSASAMPVLPVTRIKGLFLAGQSIILPGLLGATISGAMAVGGLIGFPRLYEGF